MVDRLDDYTAMSSGGASSRMPYDEVLDEARRPVRMKTLELRPDTPRGVLTTLPLEPTGVPVEPTPYRASDDLTELRRQQAEFNKERLRLDKENRPLAYGALAAPALLLGSELIGGFGFPAARAIGRPAEFNIFPPRRALNPKEKGVIGGGGREVFDRANGMSASQMGTPPGVRGARGGHVHHRTPNAHANKLPGADPNRLENLQGIPEEVHSVVTAEEAKLLKSLGRQPTPAEIELFRQRMRFIEPYTLRRGLPRPPPRIKKPPR